MTDKTAARLREVLAEIERVAPQAILQSAARVQLRALGVSGPEGSGGVSRGTGGGCRVGQGDVRHKSQSSKLALKTPMESGTVANEAR